MITVSTWPLPEHEPPRQRSPRRRRPAPGPRRPAGRCRPRGRACGAAPSPDCGAGGRHQGSSGSMEAGLRRSPQPWSTRRSHGPHSPQRAGPGRGRGLRTPSSHDHTTPDSGLPPPDRRLRDRRPRHVARRGRSRRPGVSSRPEPRPRSHPLWGARPVRPLAGRAVARNAVGHRPARADSLLAAEAVLFAALAALAGSFFLFLILALVTADSILALSTRALTKASIVAVTQRQGLLREGNGILTTVFTSTMAIGASLGGVVVGFASPQAALAGVRSPSRCPAAVVAPAGSRAPRARPTPWPPGACATH